jgi:hypothetical protein
MVLNDYPAKNNDEFVQAPTEGLAVETWPAPTRASKEENKSKPQ